jgi:hypothetical protein
MKMADHEKRSELVMVRLKPGTKQAFADQAKHAGVSESALAALILTNWLDQQGVKKNPFPLSKKMSKSRNEQPM